MMEAFDVVEAGACPSWPTRAAPSSNLWQARRHIGASVVNDRHIDLERAPDRWKRATFAFYDKVFGSLRR